MSGVYIPGFKKPTSQEQCKFFDYAPFRADYCVLFNTCKGIDKCPIVAVPNHGRLIDADALKEECSTGMSSRLTFGITGLSCGDGRRAEVNDDV